MADAQKSGLGERDIDQAITALKKGAYLLKYGRRGKPKFCPFQLSNDESMVIWYSGKQEKQLKLNQVTRIIPGQRTAIFQRYPRPEKEYQSFSLIYGDRSLDLVCKDKDEAEVWLVGLKALITRGNYSQKWRVEARSESALSDSPRARSSPTVTPLDPGPGDIQGTGISFESVPQNRLGKAFSDIILYTGAAKTLVEPVSASTNALSALTSGCVDTTNGRSSTSDAVRVSLSSVVSSSSQGSYHEDFDALGDVYIWGQGIKDGILGGGVHRTEDTRSSNMDVLLPKALESTVVIDVQNIACGDRHAVLVNRQGEIFSWGEESGGRLGHGIHADVAHPKLIETLTGMNIELLACGDYHTCAVTLHGELYTWGDGTHSSGLLGHRSEVSHWIPKKVSGDLEGLHISYISCGPWHTAAVASDGRLFTFGDGSFGVLGHGDRSSTSIPKEVEALRGLRTMKVACGIWHTAAVVEVTDESSVIGDSAASSCGRLFTWGDGDNGRLGHDDLEPRLVPECVGVLINENICQVACGHNLTIALTRTGRVYTMGSTAYGQLGSPKAKIQGPNLVGGKVGNSFIEAIACGSYHIAILTSKAEVYTWGKGTNGQLGHGDNSNKSTPTLVSFLKDKQVKAVACGTNFTAIICLHNRVSSADHSVCSDCRNPFGFRRKRHNCYNCGLVFCNACSSRKSVKASLAPNLNKPFRVCDDCFNKLKKAEPGKIGQFSSLKSGQIHHKSNEVIEKETLVSKLQTQLSRLSTAESNIQAKSRHYRQDRRLEIDGNRLFPALDGNIQLADSYPIRMLPLQDGITNTNLSNFTPGVTPLAIVPLSTKTKPPCSPEVASNESKILIGSLNEEIAALKTQVEKLTCKSGHLEAELERKTQQLEEVTAIAADEAEKCRSGKEVIKSLTAQLKEMAERQSEITKPTSSMQSVSSVDNHTNLLSREVESNGNLDHQMLSYGTKSQTEKQWVVQAEPGVYISLSPLPGGLNELKRVRFSRKHFTEQEAENWWAENGARVIERHNIQTA